MAAHTIRIAVAEGDVLAFDADVVALKHADGLYGADEAAYKRLAALHQRPPPLPTRWGEHTLLDARGALAAPQVMFVGLGPLFDIGYAQIRAFAAQVLTVLADERPATRSVAITLHGPGYGLDESEAFSSEVAGIADAVLAGAAPPALERVTLVERDPRRAARLAARLEDILPGGLLATGRAGSPLVGRAAMPGSLAGAGARAKPYVFVALPFADAFDDVYHYGIEGAVHAAGFLAERADMAAFTGDVVDWVKRRIAGARLVVADLTSANPNVYLEVGYAWGVGVPTVLLTRDVADLKFDVKGQRCLAYKSIRNLEEQLARELRALAGQANASPSAR